MTGGAFQGQTFTPNPGAGGTGSGREPSQAFWWYPTASLLDASSDEFENALSGWTVWKLNGAVWTAIATPLATPVDLSSVPAAGNVRMSVNANARRSWLQIQPCDFASGDKFVVAKQFTLLQAQAFTLTTRMSTLQEYVTDVTKAGFFAFHITKDDGAGHPDLTVTDGLQFIAARVAAANTINWRVVQRAGGLDLFNQLGPNKFGTFGEDMELVYGCPAVANGSANRVWLRGESDQLYLNSGVDGLHSGAGGSGTFWVAYQVHGGIGGVPKVFEADYYRRFNTFYGG